MFLDVLSCRKMLKLLLEKKGICNIHLSENGHEAVEFVSSTDPNELHLIFMDNMMPVMVRVSIVLIILRVIKTHSHMDFSVSEWHRSHQ